MLPVYTGFHNEKLGDMFPILFVTVACGAVSGFHSLVSSGTSSKTISNEKDMLKVGYGAMILESLLAVLALCVAGAAASADGTAVFLKVTGRTNKTLFPPLIIMLCVTFTALVERFIALVNAYQAGTAVFMVEGLQLIIAVLLIILGLTIVLHSGKRLVSKETKKD